jgi:excisionase family DNA binding protein
MTTHEAAKALGVSVRRVQAMIKSGRLPAQKVGRDWWITAEDVEKLKDRKVGRPRK